MIRVGHIPNITLLKLTGLHTFQCIILIHNSCPIVLTINEAYRNWKLWVGKFFWCAQRQMRLQTKIKVDSYCIFSSTSTHEYLIQIIGHTVLYGCVQCLAPGHIFVYQLDSGSTIYRPSRCKRTYPLVPGPLSNMLDKGWRSCPPPLKPLHWIKVWLTWCFYFDANGR